VLIFQDLIPIPLILLIHKLRNDENIISNISVTDMSLGAIWGNGIREPFPK
jgi:hypothetical protein